MSPANKFFKLLACVTILVAGLNGSAKSQEVYYLEVAVGKACWVEAYTNSAATWTMTVKDGDKTVLVFQGSGVNFAPMKVIKGNPRFTVRNGATVTFKSATGKAAIKIKNSTIASSNGDPAVFASLIGGEDGGDDDWQDILANVTCLHHAG